MMSFVHLSAILRSAAPAVGNHLWQSTLFAAAAGLLTLLLRNNQARIRYWVWLAASVKFLVPFAWMIDFGSRLSWFRIPESPSGNVYFVMEQVGRPFAATSSVATSTVTAWALTIRLLPVILLVAWLGGTILVLVLWWLRWRRVMAAVRTATPVINGREYDMLRSVERSMGVPQRIELLFSESSLEPGIVGMVHPVLLVPSGIGDRLTDQQLAAVLMHELCHVRHRDNLTAAVQMLVEALFWFHPLLWWIGARLVDERERACDEEVVRQGSAAQVYAEAILKICEFYLGSPVICAAGVTGSNLKQRIEEIMNQRVVTSLGSAKRVLLAVAAMAVVAGPLAIGVMSPKLSRAQEEGETTLTLPGGTTLTLPVGFATVSIRQNTAGVPMAPFRIIGDPAKMRGIALNQERFLTTLFPLRALIHFAYGVEERQVAGGPDWLDTNRYDIVAKMAPSQIEALQKLKEDQREFVTKKMVQSLLADRFKLSFHREIRTLATYEMAVGMGGLKLSEAGPPPVPGDTRIIQNKVMVGPGKLTALNTSMGQVADILSEQTNLKIVDKTNLKAFYNVTLKWPNPAPDLGAALATALREQLGLELNEKDSPAEVLVVDSAELPELDGPQTTAETPASQIGNTVENGPRPLSPMIHVRQDVMNGLVAHKVPPLYPEAARTSHIQGAVVLDATIGKDGSVESLQIISGHPLLAPSAIESVKQWKYQPYLVNGEPVEVMTQVQVTFSLAD